MKYNPSAGTVAQVEVVHGAFEMYFHFRTGLRCAKMLREDADLVETSSDHKTVCFIKKGIENSFGCYR